MKKLLILTLTVLMLGCSKKEDNAGNGELYLRAKIDGKLFESSLFLESRLVDAGKILGINSGNKELVQVDVVAGPFTGKPGTYGSIGEATTNCVVHFGDKPENSYGAGNSPSSLVITSVEGNLVKGTFEYTAVGDKGKKIKITEGSFAVRYTEN